MAAEPLKLTPAELAVIFQHFLARDPGSQRALFADMNVEEDQLEGARRALRERGLLMGDTRRNDTALSPALEPLLRTVTTPQALAILQVSKPGAPPRVTFINWTEGMIAGNWLDEDGQHVIQPLASLQAVGESVVGWTGAGPFKRVKKTGEIDPDSVVKNASQRAVFVAVAGVLADEQRARAACWITSGDLLWLIDGQADAQGIFIRPASAAIVRETVQTMMSDAVAETTARAGQPT